MRETAARPSAGQLVKRFGIGPVLIAALSRRLESTLGIHLWAITHRTIQDGYVATGGLTARFEFKVMTLDELLDAVQHEHVDMASEFVRAAYARGDSCFAALEDERLVAYTWRSISTVPVLTNLWINLEHADTFYGYKMWVTPALRGLRMFETLRGLFDADFVRQGITNGVSYVALSNLASIASLERDPLIRRSGYAMIFARRKSAWTFLSRRARPWISFSTRPDA